MSVLAANDPRHGRGSTYSNYRCRCAPCTEAWRVRCMAYRRRRGIRPKAIVLAEMRAQPILHGRESGYKRGCKCERCMEAARVARSGRVRTDTRRRSIGNFDLALIRRAAELEAARASVTGELAALAVEQEHDAKWGHHIASSWLVSLDARDRYGRELYETLDMAA